MRKHKNDTRHALVYVVSLLLLLIVLDLQGADSDDLVVAFVSYTFAFMLAKTFITHPSNDVR